MVIFPSPEVPFGLLQPLWVYIVRDSTGISWSNFVVSMVMPCAPLGLMSMLLQFEDTRKYRLPLGGIGLGMLVHTLLYYRFEDPRLNAFNIGIGTASLHLLGKYVEFALVKGPIIDPYRARGRSVLLTGIDMPLNSRWVGLRQLDLADFSFSDQAPRLRVTSPNGHHQQGAVNGHEANGDRGHVGVDADVDGMDEDELLGTRDVKRTSLNGSGSELHAANGHSPAAAFKERNEPTSAGLDHTPREKYLPFIDTDPPRTRFRASLLHFRKFLTSYLIVESLVGFLQSVGSGTIDNPLGTPHSIDKLYSTHRFLLFPWLRLLSGGVIDPVVAPKLVLETVVEAFVAILVWQGLVMMYELIALTVVALGVYEVEAWEVDLFDNPLMADSILDMWGRRWHQLFRHHFVLVSSAILRFLHLPITSTTLLPLVFFLSGSMHALGQLTSFPNPYPPPVWRFFLLSGLGAALEGIFRRVTGRRVRGPWGRAWMWVFFFTTGKGACWAWCDAGIGATNLRLWVPGLEGNKVAVWFEWVFKRVVADIVPSQPSQPPNAL